MNVKDGSEVRLTLARYGGRAGGGPRGRSYEGVDAAVQAVKNSYYRPSVQNARRVLRALGRFGAPLFDLTATDLARHGTVFQLGVPPRRIDLLTSIDGVTFDEAWAGRVVCRLGDVDVTVIGRDALVRNKRATRRPKDIVDLGTSMPGEAAREERAREGAAGPLASAQRR
jgi:hypothetical protein